MEPLIELCDLVAENPAQFGDKLAWMCNRCPQPEALCAGSVRVSQSQLNAVLAVSRFLSKCPESADQRPKSVILEFLRSIPLSFSPSFWPQSYKVDSVASFFVDFFGYLQKSAQLSPDFAMDVAEFSGDVIMAAVNNNVGENLEISRAFLVSLTQNFLPVLPPDGEKLVTCLLDQFTLSVQVPASPSERIGINSEASSSQSSPISTGNHHNFNSNNEMSSPAHDSSHVSGSSSASMPSSARTMVNGSATMWRSGLDSTATNSGFNNGGGGLFRQQVASFEEESVEGLEKQEIAYKLIAHVVERVKIDSKLLEQVRFIAKKQLQSLSAFLKVNANIRLYG
uniref:Phosphatidylinositol 4-kinase alpha 1-like n=1 Tax=Rhizophora mucronata TaxID=61149 RepID=A0A2P2KQZ5_RHIMU